MDPLDLLTADAWGHVVEHLEDLQDKLNLVECLPKLDEHFPEWKINEWKVAAGVLIVANYYIRRRWLSLDRHMEWAKSLLKCRLMSSYCQSKIDKWLDNHHRYENSTIYCCTLFDSQKVEKCITEMESGEVRYSPILKGIVWSCCRFTEANNDNVTCPTLERALILLSRIAAGVKKLHFLVFNIPNYEEGSVLIHRVLNTLPNLEKLWLYFEFTLRQDLPQNGEVVMAPVPRLPGLRELDIEYSNVMNSPFEPRKIFPSILPCPDLSHNFANLSSLNLPLALLKPERPLHFPKLSYLQLESIKLGDAADEERAFNVFTKLDAPLLEDVRLGFSTLGKDEHLYFIKTLVLCWLKETHPSLGCEIRQSMSNIFPSSLWFYVISAETCLRRRHRQLKNPKVYWDREFVDL